MVGGWARAVSVVVLAFGVAACGSDAEDEAGPTGTGGGGAGSGGTASGGSSGTGGTAVGGAAGAGGAAGTGGEGGAVCPTDPPGTSALQFDGIDDDVSMGTAASLGLTTLTIEAWVRRDGAGQTFGTGVGGITLVPIAGKGRGEADGSNVDCNYAFGFAGDVLGADFEDMATGGNHPIMGKTPIPWGVWHHVAATYDGKVWRLYVNGVLDAESTADATPRSDSIQHFGVGTAFDSKGVAAGRLHGAVDELRVWKVARTAPELSANMYKTLTQGTGLVGRWAFDAADAGAPDSVGTTDGTISGALFVKPGAVLDLGLPPTVSAPSPADQGSVTGTSTSLGVSVSDPEGDPLTVTFHVRDLSSDDDFTIVVLPDTQNYSDANQSLNKYFYDQTKWVMDNRAAYNILAVIHNGDIVQHGDDFDSEWVVADKAMATLEAKSADLPDGLPYGMGVGNHDQEPIGTAGNTVKFNKYFGVSRFQGRAYYGGHYGTKNDNNWITFNAGGLDFTVVSLEYDTSPDPAVLAWTRSIFLSHPGSFGIVNSHYILSLAGTFGAQGQKIYETVRDIDDVQLLTCGHIAGESKRSDTYQGNVVHSMLADYQGRTNGGNGWLRVWEFSPANGELTVRTYSPSLQKWETDADSEYTLPVDLAGAAGKFTALAVTEPVAGEAKVTLSPVAAKRTYEWYAEVSDCVHTVESPVYTFTTQ